MRPLHGGDLTAATAVFGTSEMGWLDVSTGINPIPYPVDPEMALNWGRLPTDGDVSKLITAARDYYGVPKSAEIVAAPGTQSVIQWLPRLRKLSTVNIVGPTYGEHAHCWRANGHRVQEVTEIKQADVVVVVNPNNPTGRRFDPELLQSIAQHQAANDGWLIIDEAFADVAPRVSSIEYAGTPGLIILKSIGKFFGLAGARAGFAIADKDITSELGAALGPWAVSGPSIAAATSALLDFEWQDDALSRMERDADRLDGLLTTAGLKVVGGTPLFRLVETSDAAIVKQKLGGKGVLVRSFEDHPNWLRFGLPGKQSDWQRLEAAL